MNCTHIHTHIRYQRRSLCGGLSALGCGLFNGQAGPDGLDMFVRGTDEGVGTLGFYKMSRIN